MCAQSNERGAAERKAAAAAAASTFAEDEADALLSGDSLFAEPPPLGADYFAAKAAACAEAAAAAAASPGGSCSDGGEEVAEASAAAGAAAPQPTTGVRQGATTLYCFDMDKTLLDTYDKSKWEEVHGVPWHKERGWFSSPDSFFTHDRGPAMDAYFEAVRDPDGIILLHTGRWHTMQAQALQVLASYGATRFDVIGFCSQRRGALKQKVARICQLLLDVPSINKVVLWDDKPINVQTFRTEGVLQPKKGIEVIVHDVGVPPAALDTE